MANPILEEMQELGQTITEYREVNDQRLEAVEKGLDGKAKELQAKLDKMDEAITGYQQQIKAFEHDKEKDRARIEMLEALAERPAKSKEEQEKQQHMELFLKSLRNRFEDPRTNAELKDVESKAVTIGTTTAGGFAVPKEIAMEVDALLLKLSEVTQRVKMIQVGTSDYQELVSIHGGTSGWVAEGGSRSATGTPTLRNRKPTWGELYAYPQVSEWSLQDMQFNVVEWLTNDIAEGMANTLATAIYSGDGSDKPTGMVNTATAATADYASPLRAAAAYEHVPLTNSSPIVLGADDIIDLVYQLNPRYRSNASFGMNTVTQGYVRKLKDSNGQYLWQPSLQVGQPDRLLGYEVFTWENLGNPTTANAYPIAFGDFRKAYVMAYRTELMIQSDSITSPGHVKFYVRRRYGGCPLNNDAVKLLKVAAA